MSLLHITEQILAIKHAHVFLKIWQPQYTDNKIPILLLHDSLGSVQLWRDFPERLAVATHRTVIAYDRLGFGKSDPIPSKLSHHFIQQEAHVVTELLNQLEIPQVIALGHSVGGGMAVSFAAQKPSRCTAVITLAAQAYVEQETLDGIASVKQMFQQPEQMHRLEKYHAEKAQWVLDAWTETWLSAEFRDWSLQSDLQAVSAKMLIIHGEHDEYGSVEQPKRLAKYTHAETNILPQCGHFPHREHPELVIETIQKFIAQL